MLHLLKMFKEKVLRQVPDEADNNPDVQRDSDFAFDPDVDIQEFDDRYTFGSNCFLCANHSGIEHGSVLSCAAFPKRIPVEVWDGTHPHTTPYPGDNGILFEPREDGINPFAPKEEQERQRQQRKQKE